MEGGKTCVEEEFEGGELWYSKSHCDTGGRAMTVVSGGGWVGRHESWGEECLQKGDCDEGGVEKRENAGG